MRIWKWLGWDTKEARTERVKHNNWHSSLQWIAALVASVVVAAIIWLG